MHRVPTEDAPLVLTTSDGHQFSCWIEHVDRDVLREFGSGRRSGGVHWVFLDASGRRHVGPMYMSSDPTEDLAKVVDRWWQTERAAAERRTDP